MTKVEFEAYCTNNGEILWPFYFKSIGKEVSIREVKASLPSYPLKDPEPQAISGITKQEFLDKFYEFGKFENAREWVIHLWKEHNILVLRKDVLSWIASNHPPKQNYADMTSFAKETEKDERYITD